MTRIAFSIGVVAVLVIVSLSQPAVAAVSSGHHPAIAGHSSDGPSNLSQAAGRYQTVRSVISSGGAIGLSSAGSRYQVHTATGQPLASASSETATLGFWWRAGLAEPIDHPTMVYLPLVLR